MYNRDAQTTGSATDSACRSIIRFPGTEMMVDKPRLAGSGEFHPRGEDQAISSDSHLPRLVGWLP
jgi:hypothetical protein